MMEKKRILFVITSLYNGGAEKSLVNLLSEMDYDKFEVDLLIFKPKGLFMNQIPKEVNILDRPKRLAELYDDGFSVSLGGLVKVIGTGLANIFNRRYNYRKGFRWKWFYRMYLQELPKRYDVAFAGINGDVEYFVGDKVNAGKKIIMVHNDYISSEFPKKYDFPYFEDADVVGSISDRCVKILQDCFPEMPEKFILLRNITSSKLVRSRSEEFYPEEYTKDKGLIILSIGRLSVEKGFDMAIEAARLLKERGKSFVWYIIGSGIEEANLKNLIESYQLEQYVKLLGVRENPYPYIRNCNIFAQPSRFEGKSVVLDEAKILAKPILATAYPTVCDQLTDEEGMVVEMSPEGIAEGVLQYTEKKMYAYAAYLSSHEYGNQEEIMRYYEAFEK